MTIQDCLTEEPPRPARVGFQDVALGGSAGCSDSYASCWTARAINVLRIYLVALERYSRDAWILCGEKETGNDGSSSDPGIDSTASDD